LQTNDFLPKFDQQPKNPTFEERKKKRKKNPVNNFKNAPII
jgi:hypothetical protein